MVFVFALHNVETLCLRKYVVQTNEKKSFPFGTENGDFKHIGNEVWAFVGSSFQFENNNTKRNKTYISVKKGACPIHALVVTKSVN